MASASHVNSSRGFAPSLVQWVLDDALGLPGPTPVYGIVGLQGSGKSTLAAQLVRAGASRGLRVVALSIDDFYLTRRERQRLATRHHPLLATRGPPGTHDVALACATLDALRSGAPGTLVPVPGELCKKDQVDKSNIMVIQTYVNDRLGKKRQYQLYTAT